jgi:hypothetical protein
MSESKVTLTADDVKVLGADEASAITPVQNPELGHQRSLAPVGLLRPVASPVELMTAHKEAVTIINKVLEGGKDYGTIPGCGDKPTLFNPGAQRLLIAFGCFAEFEILDQEVNHSIELPFSMTKWVPANHERPANWKELKEAGKGRNRKLDNGSWEWQERREESGTAKGLYRYVVKARIVHRDSGQAVGEGVGACSSMESKYARSPSDFENTILKMAKKRALVDAVVVTFGLSDRFTQDVEDNPDVYGGVTSPTVPPRAQFSKTFMALGVEVVVTREAHFTKPSPLVHLRKIEQLAKEKCGFSDPLPVANAILKIATGEGNLVSLAELSLAYAGIITTVLMQASASEINEAVTVFATMTPEP